MPNKTVDEKPKTKRTYELNKPIDISADDLVESIQNTYGLRGVFDLIVELDEGVGDWDFTMDLYKHFAKLKEEYERERT